MENEIITEDSKIEKVQRALDGKSVTLYCVDCKHRIGRDSKDWPQTDDKCEASLPFSPEHLVTSHSYFEIKLLCVDMRKKTGPCGWDGKLWEKK